VLLFSRMANLLELGVPEMAEQLALVTCVVDRFAKHGRVGLTGPEYQLAKAGIGIAEQLAEVVDIYTAHEAAEYSEVRIDAVLGCTVPGGDLDGRHVMGAAWVGEFWHIDRTP
jgi:hypothetical protein